MENHVKNHPFLTKDKIYYFEDYQTSRHVIVMNDDSTKESIRYFLNGESCDSGYLNHFWETNERGGLFKITFTQVQKLFLKGIVPKKILKKEERKKSKWKKYWKQT